MLKGFEHHQFIALHDVFRNLDVTGIRGIRHHIPAILTSRLIGLANTIVIVAGGTHDFGVEAFDGLAPPLTDGAVNEDHALAAESLRAPRHRAPVVAVGGTANRNLTDNLIELSRQDGFGGRLGTAGACRDFALQQPQYRISAAQGLETAKPEPARLVLVMESADAEGGGLTRQRHQRRSRIAGPGSNRAPGRFKRGIAEHRVLLIRPGGAGIGKRVFQQFEALSGRGLKLKRWCSHGIREISELQVCLPMLTVRHRVESSAMGGTNRTGYRALPGLSDQAQ